jgi:hypothetical protein
LGFGRWALGVGLLGVGLWVLGFGNMDFVLIKNIAGANGCWQLCQQPLGKKFEKIAKF